MKKLVLIALLVFLFAGTASADYGLRRWRFAVVDSDRGDTIADANFTITVYENGESSAGTIFSDEYATAKTNPITPASDSSAAVGDLEFYCEYSSVDILIASSVYNGQVKITGLSITDHRLVYPLAESVGNITAGTISATGDVTFGVDGTGVDVTFYGDTASDYVKYDQNGATNGALLFEDNPISLGDGTKILFGDALATGDLYMESTSNVLTIGQVASGTGQVKVGADNKGIDWTFYAETASDYMKWSQDGQTQGALIFEDSHILLMDDTTLLFGDGADASIMYDETTDDNLEIAVASAGMSVTVDDILVTTDGATANQFKVDATGTVAGYAAVIETTDGGVEINADGAANGDISIDAADDLGLTAAGDLTMTIGGTGTYHGILYADSAYTAAKAENYTIASPNDVAYCGAIILASGDGTTIIMPAVGTGLTYTVVNANADGTAIHVDVNASDKVLGGCGFSAALDNGDKLTNTAGTAEKGDFVTLTYGTADGWYVTAINGTWADGS